MKTYELTPVYDNRKSFYKKAYVVIKGQTRTLFSCGTPICSVARGKMKKLWDGYSVTTMRHINEFIKQQGINGGGKAWWEGVKCNE